MLSTLAAPPVTTRSAVTIINPLEYASWDSIISKDARSSFFHRACWARVLNATYRHTPAYFCGVRDGQIEQMLPVMEVSSRWTGRRGVSLPFSDFCDPLISGDDDATALYDAAIAYGEERGWKYLECRNASPDWHCTQDRQVEPALSFFGHVVELEGGNDALFARFDPAVRRGVRKAEKEGVQVEFSSTLDSIRTFFALHCLTRRRHGLPPQPFRFFENIARHVLAAGEGFVAIARLGRQPLAGSVFFQHGPEAIYKFGASDFACQHLRPGNLLMWEATKYFARNGFEQLHLGRTSLVNEGLRRFKLGFGARENRIEYRKYDFKEQMFVTAIDRAESWVNQIFRKLPLPMLRLAGRLLYPHLS
jgi:CelD/BcsL family acetyltransferase involved in cellulose biosynthesis